VSENRPSPGKQSGKKCRIINISAGNCWILLKFVTWVHYPDYSGERLAGRRPQVAMHH